jgi:hypothetical protein
MIILLSIFRYFHNEFNSIYPFLSCFLLVNIADFFVNFYLLRKKSFLISISFIEKVDLLHLDFSVFRCNQGNTLYASKKHKFTLFRPEKTKIISIENINFFLSEDRFNLFSRIRNHFLDFMSQLTIKFIDVWINLIIRHEDLFYWFWYHLKKNIIFFFYLLTILFYCLSWLLGRWPCRALFNNVWNTLYFGIFWRTLYVLLRAKTNLSFNFRLNNICWLYIFLCFRLLLSWSFLLLLCFCYLLICCFIIVDKELLFILF